MTKLNHERPFLRYVDNLRRELGRVSGIRQSSSTQKAPAEVPAYIAALNTEEIAVISGLLDVLDKYLQASIDVVDGATKSKQKRLDDAENDLRLAAFRFAAMIVHAAMNGREEPLRFYKELSKRLKRGSISAWDVLNNFAMKDAFEKIEELSITR